jgi:hypothetical protein
MSFERGELGRAKKTYTSTGATTTVLDPEIQGGDFVLLSLKTAGGTPTRQPAIGNIVQGVSFDAEADAGDADNIYNYVIL